MSPKIAHQILEDAVAFVLAYQRPGILMVADPEKLREALATLKPDGLKAEVAHLKNEMGECHKMLNERDVPPGKGLSQRLKMFLGRHK